MTIERTLRSIRRILHSSQPDPCLYPESLVAGVHGFSSGSTCCNPVSRTGVHDVAAGEDRDAARGRVLFAHDTRGYVIMVFGSISLEGFTSGCRPENRST